MEAAQAREGLASRAAAQQLLAASVKDYEAHFQAALGQAVEEKVGGALLEAMGSPAFNDRMRNLLTNAMRQKGVARAIAAAMKERPGGPSAGGASTSQGQQAGGVVPPNQQPVGAAAPGGAAPTGSGQGVKGAVRPAAASVLPVVGAQPARAFGVGGLVKKGPDALLGQTASGALLPPKAGGKGTVPKAAAGGSAPSAAGVGAGPKGSAGGAAQKAGGSVPTGARGQASEHSPKRKVVAGERSKVTGYGLQSLQVTGPDDPYPFLSTVEWDKLQHMTMHPAQKKMVWWMCWNAYSHWVLSRQGPHVWEGRYMPKASTLWEEARKVFPLKKAKFSEAVAKSRCTVGAYLPADLLEPLRHAELLTPSPSPERQGAQQQPPPKPQQQQAKGPPVKAQAGATQQLPAKQQLGAAQQQGTQRQGYRRCPRRGQHQRCSSLCQLLRSRSCSRARNGGTSSRRCGCCRHNWRPGGMLSHGLPCRQHRS